MKLKEFDIILDIKKSVFNPCIEVVQGDYGTNIFNIFIVDGKNEYILDGLNVEIAFSKPDGTTVLQNNVTINSNKITCILSTNTISIIGPVRAEVRILKDIKVLTTSNFSFFVRESILSDRTIKSTNEFPLLQKLTDDIQGAISSEQNRVEAENGRVEAENGRVEAENGRVEAENGRVEAVPKIEAELNVHKADDVQQNIGVHGFRVADKKAQIKNEDTGEWENIQVDAEIVDPDSWTGIQKIIRAGQTNNFFSVGNQLVSAYDDREIIWEVIGIDVDTPSDSSFVHSMTLQTKDCLHDIQFDAKESTNPDSGRKSYGNNRYIHSAVRQWLNSNESSFNWVSQHQYDSKPTDSLGLYNGAGFLNRLDPELKSVIGLVNKKVARNTVVDGGGQDNFTDKVFLLSQKELDLGDEGDVTGEFIYPFYDGIINAGRIKQLNGLNKTWWLRSPSMSISDRVHDVNTGGTLDRTTAISARGVSPACVII